MGSVVHDSIVVRISTRDVRGLRGGLHVNRDGPTLHVACSGVVLSARFAVVPAHVLGAWMDDVGRWRDPGVFALDAAGLWTHGDAHWMLPGTHEAWLPLRVVRFVRHAANIWSRLAAPQGRWRAAHCVPGTDVGVGWFALLECVQERLPATRLARPAAASLPRDTDLVARQCAYALTLGQAFGVVGVPGRVVSQSQGAVVLTDHVCYPGGEGALLLDATTRSAVGVLVCALDVDEAPATLSVAVSMDSLLSAVEPWVSRAPPAVPVSPAVPAPHALSQSVVRVASSAGVWGTGVRLGHGRVLTAAHVVRPTNARGDAAQVPVAVAVDGHASAVEFMQCASLDAATLSVPALANDKPPALWRDGRPPLTGTPVELVSYCSHDITGGLCVTRGVLLRAHRWLLVASAPAFSGSSGGALFVGDTMVGLVVSTPAQGKQRVPRLTLAIPVSALSALLDPPTDLAALHELRTRNKECEQLWSLVQHVDTPPGGPAFRALVEFIKSGL